MDVFTAITKPNIFMISDRTSLLRGISTLFFVTIHNVNLQNAIYTISEEMV